MPINKKKYAGYEFPFDDSLCVIPSQEDNESQYESFQAIFAEILSAMGEPEVRDTSKMTPYELLCFKNGILLTTDEAVKNTNPKSIFFKSEEVTHYISSKGNPYDLYQAVDTQGFCQMFAFFITIGDVSEFKQVNQSPPIDVDNFIKLSENTFNCGLKTLKILESNPDVYSKFDNDFMKLVTIEKSRKKFGIKKGTTTQVFLNDFKKFTLKDAMYYIIDNPLNGHTPQTNETTFWNPLGLERTDDKIGESIAPQSLSGVKRGREQDSFPEGTSPAKKPAIGGKKTKRRPIKKSRKTRRRKQVT